MKYLEDIHWLHNRKPDATEREKDMFVEKVSVCVIDGMGEDEARETVLEWINEDIL